MLGRRELHEIGSEDPFDRLLDYMLDALLNGQGPCIADFYGATES